MYVRVRIRASVLLLFHLRLSQNRSISAFLSFFSENREKEQQKVRKNKVRFVLCSFHPSLIPMFYSQAGRQQRRIISNYYSVAWLGFLKRSKKDRSEIRSARKTDCSCKLDCSSLPPRIFRLSNIVRVRACVQYCRADKATFDVGTVLLSLALAVHTCSFIQDKCIEHMHTQHASNER